MPLNIGGLLITDDYEELTEQIKLVAPGTILIFDADEQSFDPRIVDTAKAVIQHLGRTDVTLAVKRGDVLEYA